MRNILITLSVTNTSPVVMVFDFGTETTQPLITVEGHPAEQVAAVIDNFCATIMADGGCPCVHMNVGKLLARLHSARAGMLIETYSQGFSRIARKTLDGFIMESRHGKRQHVEWARASGLKFFDYDDWNYVNSDIKMEVSVE